MIRSSTLPGLLGLALAAPLVALSLTVPANAGQEPAPVRLTLSASAEQTADAVAVAAAQQRRTAAFAAGREALAAAERAEAERVAAEQAALVAARAAEAERASRSRRAAADPRAVARSLLAARGQGDQFACLDKLWTKESGWKVTADNPTSSAYGIPQALPGKKMAAAGADWRTSADTQIRWGLGYIAEVYGGPCAAWRHSQARNWY
jgi:hypothetical protein